MRNLPCRPVQINQECSIRGCADKKTGDLYSLDAFKKTSAAAKASWFKKQTDELEEAVIATPRDSGERHPSGMARRAHDAQRRALRVKSLRS